MKKFALLSLSLLASTIINANMVVEVVCKKADQEMVMKSVASDGNDLIYDFGHVKYRVVTRCATTEDGQMVTSLDVFMIKDDVETLLAQPTMMGLPAMVSCCDGDESLTITVSEEINT